MKGKGKGKAKDDVSVPAVQPGAVMSLGDVSSQVSYKDMKELLKTEKEAMVKAVNMQDFKSAAEMEAKM